jgi:peroxiredoxin
MTTTLAIGEAAPPFELPDTDGAAHSLNGDGDAPAAATVVGFTCNHCPYALAWHDRLLAVARDYADRGVRVLQINANDAARHPRDSFEAMKARVDAGEFAGPYLHDETQEVARAWGAKTTPDVFVTTGDGVVYRGAPDADHGDPSLHAEWLREALDAVLAGEDPPRAETKPVGCSVKWK